MFEQQSKDNKEVSRRVFFAAGAAAVGGLILWPYRHGATVVSAKTEAPVPTGPVKIIAFDNSGKRMSEETLPRVVKTDAEWQKQLSPAEYDITRRSDTEMAYTGRYWDNHNAGLYRCVCCDTALFSSKTKFDSGTGWPSFWAPIAKENVTETNDSTLGMERTAVSCTRCNAHLGHVFNDGPAPTGLRYCMNSFAMKFYPSQQV